MPWTQVNGVENLLDVYASVNSPDIYATWNALYPGFRYVSVLGRYNAGTNRFDALGSEVHYALPCRDTVAVVTTDPHRW